MPARRLLPLVLLALVPLACSTGGHPVALARTPAPVAATTRPPQHAVVATRPSRPSPAPRPTATATVTGDGCPAPGRSTLVVDGRAVLRGVPAGTRPPLVLALAGYDQTRQDLDRVSHLVDRARAAGVEALLLQGTGDPAAWDYNRRVGRDVPFARDVLAAVGPCVDLHRLVLLGFSDGGLEAMRLGCALGPAVRDLVLLSASVDPEQGCRLPGTVLAVHGDTDPIDPYGGTDQGIPPARSANAAWAAAAGCTALTDRAAGPGVDVRSYPPCPVSLVTLHGGGHAWPDGEPSANPHAGAVFHGYDLTALLIGMASA